MGVKPSSTPAGGGTADQLGWEIWWYFNHHRLIGLRERIQQGERLSGDDEFFLGDGQVDAATGDRTPDPKQLRGTVVPALLQALESDRDPEIVTSALVALGKLGHAGHADPEELHQVFRRLATDPEQLVSETAVMSLGILASPVVLQDLENLLFDREEARQWIGSTVPTRLRALAAVGLGLVGESHADPVVRLRVAGSLAQILEGPEHFAHQDVPVAALGALAMCPLPKVPVQARDLRKALEASMQTGEVPSRVLASRAGQIALVRSVAEPRAQGARNPDVRAHAVRALGKLAADVRGAGRHDVQQFLHRLLRLRGGDTERVQVAAIQALGLLADCDGDQADQDSRVLMMRLARDGSPLVRRLARIAAARVVPRDGTGSAGGSGREVLQRSLVTGLSRAKSREKAWCALALGLVAHGDLELGRRADPRLVEALRHAGSKEKSPLDQGAYALALGLARDGKEAIHWGKRFQETAVDASAGQIALGLGLMGVSESRAVLLAELDDSMNLPMRLMNTAIGLGLLGEGRATPKLVDLVANASNTTSQAAAAVALGWIGDGRAVSPLLRQLAGEARRNRSRAFAMVALGRIGSGRLLPWNATLAEDMPYTAMTATLLDGTGGVLDVF